MRKLLGLAVFMALACGSAVAEPFPTRFVTMVVPFAPGGSTDVIARIVADGMSEDLGQRIIIENVAGAGGTTGSIRVMRSGADGYTILAGHMGTHASAYSLYSKVRYDPRSDFLPIGLAASAPIVVFARKDLAADNLKDFIKYLKDNGERVKVGHNGIGSNAHLTCLLLASLLEAKPTEVAYRGNAPLMNDLMAGQIDYSCDQVLTVVPQVEGGTIKAIVTAAPSRSNVLPKVATTVEAGLPAYQVDAWTALFAPAGTPVEIADRLNQALVKALDNPNVVKRLTDLGAIVPPRDQRSRSFLKSLVETDVKRWADVITKANVKID